MQTPSRITSPNKQHLIGVAPIELLCKSSPEGMAFPPEAGRVPPTMQAKIKTYIQSTLLDALVRTNPLSLLTHEELNDIIHYIFDHIHQILSAVHSDPHRSSLALQALYPTPDQAHEATSGFVLDLKTHDIVPIRNIPKKFSNETVPDTALLNVLRSPDSTLRKKIQQIINAHDNPPPAISIPTVTQAES